MFSSPKSQLRNHLIVLLLCFIIFVFLLISFYGLNHLLNDENKLLKEDFSQTVPNIYDCNFNYYEIKTHMKESNFSKLRFRKSATQKDNCYGKITYTGITPGTKFSDLSKDSYIEFGVSQKLGLPLWLFEEKFLLFLIAIFTIIIFQIVFHKKNFFTIYLLTILIYSLYTFNENNMFINSSKIYFPNQETTNSQFFDRWIANGD